MECPNCKAEVKGFGIHLGLVRVASFSCSCGRHWKHCTFLQNVGVDDLVYELERLRKRPPLITDGTVASAVQFLEYNIDLHKEVKVARSVRERRNDIWEKRFLKEAIGEDLF